MAKVITFQICGIVLDVLYRNSCRPKDLQKNIKQMSKDCGVSVNTLTSFRDILIKRKVLIKEGERRNQYIYWNPQKSSLNPVMQKSVYEEYIGSEKRKVKLKVNTTPKKSSRVSLETALRVLVKNGFTGTIRRQTNHYTTECIDLSLIKVEE